MRYGRLVAGVLLTAGLLGLSGCNLNNKFSPQEKVTVSATVLSENEVYHDGDMTSLYPLVISVPTRTDDTGLLLRIRETREPELRSLRDVIQEGSVITFELDKSEENDVIYQVHFDKIRSVNSP